MRPTQRGFSLVELAIVLVIIGLVAGATVVSKSLIRTARIRTILTDYENYTTAAKNFRTKYSSIPGDMPDAISVWGAQHATPATCATTASTNALTCNGDGNGIISYSTGSQENFRFWQHLASAGVLDGRYTGVTASGSAYNADPGTNAPKGRLANSGWSAANATNYVGDTEAYELDFGNYLLFGAATATSVTTGVMLTPAEAWSLDLKIDDGKPASGTVIARYWNNLCAEADDGGSADNDLAASYRVDDPTVRCALQFRNLF